MIRKAFAAAAAAMLAAGPCLAAEIPGDASQGARRSGAVAGLYFKMPLGGGGRTKAPRAGLRLSMVHDYRTAGAGDARVVQSDGLDLRLIGGGAKKPTLYFAGQPVTGEQANKRNFNTGGTVVTVVLVAAVAVGAFYLARAIDDSGEE